jgi:hypothetical protein
LGAKRLTPFWKVRSVISLFVQMGCEVRAVEGEVVAEDGDVLNFRYLVNPDTKAFVAIVDLGDEEFVSAVDVVFWERRLGVTIPKPPA